MIEVEIEELNVLNPARSSLPFNVGEHQKVTFSTDST